MYNVSVVTACLYVASIKSVFFSIYGPFCHNSRGNGGGATVGFFPVVIPRLLALVVLVVVAVLAAVVRNDDAVDTVDVEEDMYDAAVDDGIVSFGAFADGFLL